MFRGDDENVTLLRYRRAAQSSIVQKLVGIHGIKGAVVFLRRLNRTVAVKLHLHRHRRVGLQLFRNRVVVKGVNLDADPMIVAKLVILTKSCGGAQQILVTLIGHSLGISHGGRILIPVELAFGGC